LKDLLLLRHAKSGWENPGLADIDRPLSKRGRKAGVRLAGWFQAHKCRPALILCSDARRTRETLELLLPAWSQPPETRYLERLYLAEPDELMACLHEVSDATPSVLLIGHNPGLQELALQLLPVSASETRTRIDAKFPTGALVRLSSRARSWSRLAPGKLKLVTYVTPAELQD
jgi:phosphohistidine phosphatase